MYRVKAATASWLTSSRQRSRRLSLLVAFVALALVSVEGTATASAPLKVCATCAYTDISAALAAAAAQSGDDAIHVAAGTYPDAIVVSTNVTLLGAGAEATTIGKVRVDAGVVVTFKGVTINGGPSGFPDDASGVKNAGTLTLKNSVVSGNAAIFGAGIYNESTGTITVKDSTITGNSAILGNGGGIVNEGTLMLQNTALSGNGTFGAGGGISCQREQGVWQWRRDLEHGHRDAARQHDRRQPQRRRCGQRRRRHFQQCIWHRLDKQHRCERQ